METNDRSIGSMDTKPNRVGVSGSVDRQIRKKGSGNHSPGKNCPQGVNRLIDRDGHTWTLLPIRYRRILVQAGFHH